jgi:NADH-quinone oxidoreductase subunit E
MLTAEERAAIAHLSAEAPLPSAAMIDVLLMLQKRRGYISDEVLSSAARALHVSPAALDEVATFYNLIFRQPVGRHVLKLCDSAMCWMLGRDRLQAQLFHRLGIRPGETTADGKFTLLPIVCLGACDRAPALMMGETLHGDVSAPALDALIASAP